MFSKKELIKIKKALPKGAYKLIAEKLGEDTSPASVKMILNYPERYKKAVFDVATEVIKEHKAQIAKQKADIKEAMK